MTEHLNIEDCYCVCHSPVSSCSWCEHCKGKSEVTRFHQATAAEFITWGYGERCKTSDIEDFPETDYDDLKNSRCACCEMWEHYDEFLAETK
jgi:hypothetical protein